MSSRYLCVRVCARARVRVCTCARVCACACVKFNFELDDQFSQNLVVMLYLTRTTSNNKAVVRTCEVVATLASLTPGSAYYNW